VYLISGMNRIFKHFFTRSMLQRINEEVHTFVSFVLLYRTSFHESKSRFSKLQTIMIFHITATLSSFFLSLDLCFPTYGVSVEVIIALDNTQ